MQKGTSKFGMYFFHVPCSNCQDVVNYIRDNSEKYREFLTEDIDIYLDKLSRNGAWGDHFAQTFILPSF